MGGRIEWCWELSFISFSFNFIYWTPCLHRGPNGLYCTYGSGTTLGAYVLVQPNLLKPYLKIIFKNFEACAPKHFSQFIDATFHILNMTCSFIEHRLSNIFSMHTFYSY